MNPDFATSQLSNPWVSQARVSSSSLVIPASQSGCEVNEMLTRKVCAVWQMICSLLLLLAVTGEAKPVTGSLRDKHHLVES